MIKLVLTTTGQDHFAHNLQCYARDILGSARFHMHTSLLKGGNRIKMIKRMAYGFRYMDHFVLKIKAAFLGKMR